MGENADVVIIGSGIIGCATAFELGKKGYKTRNIDMLPEAGYGSTSFSSAIIRFFYSTLDSVALAYESHFHWKDWKNYLNGEEGPFAEFNQVGSVMLKSPDYDHVSLVERYNEVGIPYEDWDCKKLEEKVPFLHTQAFSPSRDVNDYSEKPKKKIEGAIYTPDSGYVDDPKLAAKNLQRAAEQVGGTFMFNTKVENILTQNNRVKGLVYSKKGDTEELDVPIIINAAGPHSSKINDLVNLQNMNIETKALREEVHHIPVLQDSEATFMLHISDGDFQTYFHPINKGGKIVGVGGEDQNHQFVDPDNFDDQISPEKYHSQVMRAMARFPAVLGMPGKAQGVVALYDWSSDWTPIYDKSSVEGYYMAIGTSGNQFKNAPVVGKIMAELVENGQNHDTQPLSIECQFTPHIINLGSFSRLREINKETSYSVRG